MFIWEIPSLAELFGGGVMSAAQWRSVAVVAGGTGGVESRLRAVCPVATTQCLGRVAGPRRAGPRPAIC